MTYLAPKLNRRVHICEPVQTANVDGGFDRSYTVLKTIWAGVKAISANSFTAYVRGVNSQVAVSHEFTVRQSAIVGPYDKGFSAAFEIGDDTILFPKSEYYIWMYETSSTRGRYFRIVGATKADERNEYVKILTKEEEEYGTGYDS